MQTAAQPLSFPRFHERMALAEKDCCTAKHSPKTTSRAQPIAVPPKTEQTGNMTQPRQHLHNPAPTIRTGLPNPPLPSSDLDAKMPLPRHTTAVCQGTPPPCTKPHHPRVPSHTTPESQNDAASRTNPVHGQENTLSPRGDGPRRDVPDLGAGARDRGRSLGHPRGRARANAARTPSVQTADLRRQTSGPESAATTDKLH